MFTLENITSANAEWKPQRILLYGPQGLGKSTFGATFDKPIMARTEDGSGNIDVATFPDLVTSFADIEAVIKALHGEHNFKTAIVDSLDWLEPLVWKKQIDEQPVTDKGAPVNNIEDYGWGKGYAMADTWWRYLMGGFDSLRLNKGMNIVLIAHAEIKSYTSPETDPYDRYQIKLQKRAFALWQEWADMVLFAKYKTSIQKTETGFNKEIRRGVGSGERIICTEERPAYLAKNRWGLPPEIYIGQDKAWSGFHQALHDATGGRYGLPGEGA